MTAPTTTIPHSSDVLLPVTGGSTATTTRSEDPAAIVRLAPLSSSARRPERAVLLLDQHAIQFLPADARAAIAAAHLLQKRCCQIGPVGLGRRMGQHCRRVLQHRLQHLDIARRRGHHLPRMPAQTQRELQHVPGLAAPSSTLPAHRPRPHRTAGRAGFPGSCAENTCATAPLGQTSRLRVACHSGRRSGGEQARMPLSPITITSRTCSIVSPTSATWRARPGSAGVAPSTSALHPLGPGPRLARAAPAHDHPGLPGAIGRQLMRQGPELEHPGQRQQRVFVESAKKLIHHLRRRGGKPGGARSQPGRRRSRGRGRGRPRQPACGVFQCASFRPSPSGRPVFRSFTACTAVFASSIRPSRRSRRARARSSAACRYRSSVSASRSTGSGSMAAKFSVIDRRTRPHATSCTSEMKKRPRGFPAPLAHLFQHARCHTPDRPQSQVKNSMRYQWLGVRSVNLPSRICSRSAPPCAPSASRCASIARHLATFSLCSASVTRKGMSARAIGDEEQILRRLGVQRRLDGQPPRVGDRRRRQSRRSHRCSTASRDAARSGASPRPSTPSPLVIP